MKLVYLFFFTLIVALGFGCNEGPPQPIDLVQGIHDGDFTCTINGEGDSTNVTAHLHNNTGTHWEIEIKPGYKLEPAEDNCQEMVVTFELEVELHARKDADVDLPVACLDISREPPMTTNVNWTVKESSALAGFIPAALNKIDEINRQSTEKFTDDQRRSILQTLLWKARGASRQDWINFMVEYQGLSEAQASQQVDEMDSDLNGLVQDLPNIQNE